MIREIVLEIEYCFQIIVIIAIGMMFCDLYNREAIRHEWYQNYEYNLNPSEGTGWTDSIIKPK